MAAPRVEADALRRTEPHELAIRFGFGAAISVLAGIVSLAFGARAGGLFLAFPAILPATLTLIEKKHSKRDAEQDDEGAVLGAIAMIAFAAIAALAFTRFPVGIALALAGVGWFVVAVVLYAVVTVLDLWPD